MSNFKVGDRVAVYAAGLDLFGEKATVESLLPEGRLYVKLDQPNELADTPRVHSKQCRRLVKRERRRLWITEAEAERLRFAVDTDLPAPAYGRPGRDSGRWIEFVEVRKKK